MEPFVDRERELDGLTECYESAAVELAVIYGRRRLGKTELVKQSIAEREDVVFYQAREKTKTLQLDQFASAAAEAFPGIERIQSDWESLLGYLAEQDATVILDEFPLSHRRR
jgi:Predicted ATPase (AAA+ superfamily)